MARLLKLGPVSTAIIAYLFVILLILLRRPNALFIRNPVTGESRLRKFGIGHNETLFSFHLITIILAIVTFFTSISMTL